MTLQKKISVALLLSTGILSVLFAFTLHARSGRAQLAVDVLDVGQGDAILIKTPYEQNILIDGGPGDSVLDRLGEELPFYDKHIDLMILTHPHADHVTGLVDVLKRYQVDRVLYTGAVHTSSAYLTWLEEIKNKHIPLDIVDVPRDIHLGADLELKLLFPRSSVLNQKMENLNNSSIVSKLVYKDTSFLLMGDAETPVEEELLAADREDLDADVLKLGHHGSHSSTSETFLDAVSPQYGVASAGEKNRYGHPHAETLKKFFDRHIPLYRTDLDGTVEFDSDGNKITVK